MTSRPATTSVLQSGMDGGRPLTHYLHTVIRSSVRLQPNKFE